MLRIRWVTWWPVWYWNFRFEALSRLPDVDLEVIYLAASSTQYPTQVDPASLRFKHRILSQGSSDIGFRKLNLRIANPLPIVRGAPGLHLVMPYGHPTFIVAAALAKLKGVPYHLFVPNTNLNARSESTRNETLKRLAFRGAAGAIVTGKQQVDYARRYAPPGLPMSIVGNPVDGAHYGADAARLLPRRDAIRAELGWRDQLVVSFVGRLVAEKDLATLFRAAQRLKQHGRDVLVAIAGTGPLDDTLHGLAATLGIEVDFLGFRRDEELSKVYAGSDVFVLPSTTEAWGLVVNEAMEFGLPVIVSDRVGAREIIADGANGLVFPAGDDAALAALVDSLSEPALRHEIGARAREMIREHTLERWLDGVTSHFRAFAADPGREGAREAVTLDR